MKFIHLTDPHLVAPGQRLYTLDPAQRLQQAVMDINTHHADARFLLITGNLAHWGQAAAYRELRLRLDALAMPYRLLIGNHDDRELFWTCLGDTPRYADAFVQYSFDTPAGVFLVLDSTLEDSHAGALCQRRLDCLAAMLRAHVDRDLYLALHHAPVASGIPGVDAGPLQDPESLWQVLRTARSLRHILFGHVQQHDFLDDSPRFDHFEVLQETPAPTPRAVAEQPP